jgi:hypothetical protein
MISEIEDVLKRNIMVIVTMSLDGIGRVHDYARVGLSNGMITKEQLTVKDTTKTAQTFTVGFLDHSELFEHKELARHNQFREEQKHTTRLGVPGTTKCFKCQVQK